MLFGQFLLRKKIIEKPQFIKAFVVQTKEAPSLIEILSEINGVDSVLKVVWEQMEQGKAINQLQKENCFFSEEAYKKAFICQAERRRPMGQILVEQGVLNPTQLEAALMEFSKVCSDQEPIYSTYGETDDAEGAGSIVGPEISEAALESLKELVEGGTVEVAAVNELSSSKYQQNGFSKVQSIIEELDSNFIEAFVERAHMDKLKKMEASIVEAELADNKINIVLGIRDEVLRIKGAAELANAKLCSLLSQCIEESLSAILENKLQDFEMSVLFAKVKEGLHILLDVSNIIETEKTESLVSEKPELIERIEAFLIGI